jgi:hypothetical protein
MDSKGIKQRKRELGNIIRERMIEYGISEHRMRLAIGVDGKRASDVSLDGILKGCSAYTMDTYLKALDALDLIMPDPVPLKDRANPGKTKI